MGIGSDIRIYLESERMWMRLFAVGEETENGSEKGYPNFDLVPFNLSTYPPSLHHPSPSLTHLPQFYLAL